MPHASGVKHEYRQKILNEGGIGEAMHVDTMPGQADLPSDGIEDNFSRSKYPGSQPQTQLSPRLDLPEMREAGKYTPRKQTGNPSGNDNGETLGQYGVSNKALKR